MVAEDLPLFLKTFLTVLTSVGALFFALCAYWQLNDPDAFWWVLIYTSASLLGIAAIFARLSWKIPAILALGAMGFSLHYVWEVLRHDLHYFEDEAGREMLGSLMVCFYLFLLVLYLRLKQR